MQKRVYSANDEPLKANKIKPKANRDQRKPKGFRMADETIISDNNFTASAKKIVCQHKDETKIPQKKKNEKGKYSLTNQLNQLRKEYELSTRLLDEDQIDNKELNLHSHDPDEIPQESAFSNYTTRHNPRSGKRGFASRNNIHFKNEKERHEMPPEAVGE